MLATTLWTWKDPATWPWIIYVWLAFFLAGWLKPAWRWLQRTRSAGWPVADGRIDSADVAMPKMSVFSARNRSYRFGGELSYSYSVAGNVESGRYRRDFASEQDARNFVRDLKGKPLAIRYNPNRAASSWPSEPALETLLRSRAAIPASESFANGDPVPEWSHPFLGILAGLAAAGLVVSLWVHLGALMGRRVAPEQFFWILHVGIFVVWIPTVLVARKLIGATSRNDIWKIALKGSPAWMRYMTYGFFGYAILNFALFFGSAPHGQSGPNPPAAVWRGFSGHWMAFYSAAFAILYSRARANSGWRCPNGHSVQASARSCGFCGQPRPG